MLKVKLLAAGAKAPTVAHPWEDLAYDLYALEDIVVIPGDITAVKTGVAAECVYLDVPMGLLVRDRSSMARKGVITHGGVIDAGYRGEIVVLMSLVGEGLPYYISAGDKIAQMIPMPVLTGDVEVVEELTSASRGEKGFGSSGR